MRILLAEDEPDIQLITRMALEDAGHEVVVVGDGDAAIAYALGAYFDVILLDVMMPYLDGFATCTALKVYPHTATIPIIFLTAKSQEFEIQRGRALGAIGYIVKPFDVFSLSNDIDRILAEEGRAWDRS